MPRRLERPWGAAGRARFASNGPAPGAARLGLGRRGIGRSSRGSRASSDRLETRPASGGRSPRVTTTPRARSRPAGAQSGDGSAWRSWTPADLFPGPAVGPPGSVMSGPAIGRHLRGRWSKEIARARASNRRHRLSSGQPDQDRPRVLGPQTDPEPGSHSAALPRRPGFCALTADTYRAMNAVELLGVSREPSDPWLVQPTGHLASVRTVKCGPTCNLLRSGQRSVAYSLQSLQ